MDKTDLRNKRRQDKSHKKVPPPKPAKPTVAAKVTRTTVPEVQHTAPLVVCDQRYGKRQIQQNWTEDRDLPSDGNESEDEQLNAADFEKLLAVPPSTSGHFLLSTEKHWLAPETGQLEGEDQKTCYNEYFRIDTKLLNASLECIPFHQRLGYDESLFSASELNSIRHKAEIQLVAYRKLCVEHTTQTKMGPVKPPKPAPCLVGKYALPENTVEQIQSVARPEVEVPQKSEVAPVIQQQVEAKISTLKIGAPISVPVPPASSSSVILPSKPPNAPPTTKKETKEDIQQWLDDILDI